MLAQNYGLKSTYLRILAFIKASSTSAKVITQVRCSSRNVACYIDGFSHLAAPRLDQGFNITHFTWTVNFVQSLSPEHVHQIEIYK